MCLGYGVIANVSRAGACVWTDGTVPTGARLSFRLSFCQPAEVHEVEGVVIWERATEGPREPPSHRFGVEWQEAPPACEERLQAMVSQAEEEMLTPRSLAALRRSRVEH